MHMDNKLAARKSETAIHKRYDCVVCKERHCFFVHRDNLYPLVRTLYSSFHNLLEGKTTYREPEPPSLFSYRMSFANSNQANMHLAQRMYDSSNLR
jgi:hypothetical protein